MGPQIYATIPSGFPFVLGIPALTRGHHITHLHRRFGPAAWPFIIAADAAAALGLVSLDA